MNLRLLQRMVRAALLLALAGLAAGWAAVDRRLAGGPSPPAPSDPGPLFADPAPSWPAGEVWARPGLAKIADEVGNYRLAGTFQTYAFEGEDPGGDPVGALALVDDLRAGRQRMVRRGDALGPFTVAEIERDRVLLDREGRRWILRLPGVLARRATPRGEDRADSDAAPRRFEDLPALETTPYGKRVSENQWVIDRRAVMAYAGEIMDSPVRAIRLYRSFDQVGDEQEEPGFRLRPKGEKPFFRHMGLRENDVIRKVNSMRMENQARAEYLVREFMKARMSAVVLDVEREGETEKLIYIIR